MSDLEDEKEIAFIASIAKKEIQPVADDVKKQGYRLTKMEGKLAVIEEMSTCLTEIKVAVVDKPKKVEEAKKNQIIINGRWGLLLTTISSLGSLFQFVCGAVGLLTFIIYWGGGKSLIEMAVKAILG